MAQDISNNVGLRLNNPGNLKDPATGQFRVFPTPEAGNEALVNDIKLKQSGQSAHIKPGASIQDFANVWAPSSDNNNPHSYAQTLAKYLGVPTAYAFDQVDPTKLAGAVKVAEGTSTPATDTSTGNTVAPTVTPTSSNNDLIKANVLKLQNANATPEDIEAYVKSASQEQSVSPGTSPGTSDGHKTFAESVSGIANNQPDAALKAGDPGVLGDISGTGKLGQGLGYAISNALGTQDSAIKGLNQLEDTQTGLIQKIHEARAKGEDTTKLMSALNDLTGEIEKSGGQISDIGTGGITNKQVLSSAAKTAIVPAAMYGTGLIGGLVKGTSALESPVIEEAMSKFNMPIEEFNSLSNSEKLNALSEAAKQKDLSASAKLVVNKAIQEVTPLAEKELGTAPTIGQRVLSNGSTLFKKGVQGAGLIALNKVIGPTATKVVQTVGNLAK